MRGPVALLMLVLVVGSATGAFAAVAEAATCQDDCEQGDADCCPPVCPQCVCAARGIVVVSPQPIALPSAAWSRMEAIDREVSAPESADGDEILHVPIVAR